MHAKVKHKRRNYLALYIQKYAVKMRITIGDSDYMVEIAAVDEMTNVCNCYLMQTISWISATIRCLYE